MTDHEGLRLVALGGLGEFGLNALVLRYDLKHGMSKMRAAGTIVDTLVLMARNLRGR